MEQLSAKRFEKLRRIVSIDGLKQGGSSFRVRNVRAPP